jgi:hypothetical protein
MEAFKGYEAKATEGGDKLPVGNYKVRIIDAAEVTYSWGNVLQIRFDIDDGPFKDYYTNRYRNRQNKDENYKGVFRLTVPKGDDTDKDAWNIRRFNNAMGVLEKDNPGWKWRWDEKKLSGLKCGMVFRSKEWEYNGKTGFYPEPYNLASRDVLDMIATPAPKRLARSIDIANDEFVAVDSSAGDLPF